MQLTLNAVEVRRGDFTLHASGSFDPGIHLLTGRVGSGKSTLGELLTGILKPHSGLMTCIGISSSILSMQFPEYHITTTTAGEEAVSWGLDPVQVLDRAGLTGRGCDDILTLSRGELKRLHLSCLLASMPDLLVLDEPYAGLDEDARSFVSSLLNEQKGRIIIIISHDITSLPCIDHLWEIRRGILIDLGLVPASIAA